MTKRNQRLFALGVFLALVGILMAASFYFVDNHRWYWNAVPILCVLGILSAASGGFLIGRSLVQTHKRRLWLVVLGGTLGLAWIASSITAVGFAFSGMNYFPAGDSYISWDSYHGDYLVGYYHIWSLQAATLTGLLGGFSIGFGSAPKRKEANNG